MQFTFKMSLNRVYLKSGGKWVQIPDLANDDYSVKRVGHVMTLKTWFGLTLFRDWHTISLRVPAIFMGKLGGLCQIP